jgi:hypothetical protein
VARAIVTLVLDLDHARDADGVRSLLVAHVRHELRGIAVAESHVAVDQSLTTEDIDE